jgi:hypothetical protein
MLITTKSFITEMLINEAKLRWGFGMSIAPNEATKQKCLLNRGFFNEFIV